VCVGGGGGAVLPRASAARSPVEQRGPVHLSPFGDITVQAEHTQRTWASSQASGGDAPVYRCGERRWETSDCRQPHPVGEAPSRHAHRGIGQNHMPDGWAEATVRGRDRGCYVEMGALPGTPSRTHPFPWGL